MERRARTTGSTCSACRTTTPARWARTRGGTSRSSSSRGRSAARTPAWPGCRPGRRARGCRRRPSTPLLRDAPRGRRRAAARRPLPDRAGRRRPGRTGRGPGHAARSAARATGTGAEGRTAFRWLMASDVCKHCTHAGCLDVCPTGALFRTEFGTVVVQQDICNGCGYCVSGCPYGVIDRRPGRRPGPEVHAVLRPAARRPGAGLRARRARPSRSSSASSTSCASGPPRGSRSCTSAGVTEARLYGRRPGRRRRRRRRVLPAARRAGGVRPAAGPGRAHPRPAVRMWRLRRRALAGRRSSRAAVGGPWRADEARDAGTAAAGPTPLGRARRAPASGGRRRRRAADGGAPSSGPTRADACRSRVPLLLRPADPQAAGVEATRSPRTCSPAAWPPAAALLAAGADLTGRPALRRASWLGSLGGAGRQHVLPGRRPRPARRGSTTCCGWPSRPRR